jgi:2-octaprenyl-6-methoxyphenol hydroxylase
VPTDLAIIGGGLVGYTAALAFAQGGYSVQLLEAKLPDLEQLLQSEGRAIALAHTSVILYQSLGLWSELSKCATPIKKIIISEQHSFGKCRINAADYDLNALGYIVPATHLFKVLFEAVNNTKNITLKAPFIVDNIDEQIDAKWILACDGTQSFARKYFNISVTEKDYEQIALVANVTLSNPHEGIAYQRLTEKGVLALLPLPEPESCVIARISKDASLRGTPKQSRNEQRMTSVLTVSKHEFDSINQKEYLDLLQYLLGKRIGLLSNLGKIFTYPLTWMQANQVMIGRTILLGNAANTISPIAAQGFNLALRDLALLYDLMRENRVDEYPVLSKQAQQAVLNFTDLLTDWVKPTSLSVLRSVGLFTLDHLGFIKKPLAQSLMGLSRHGGSLMRSDLDAS